MRVATVLLTAIVSMSSGCISVDEGSSAPPPRSQVGPPTHAPAHGYRHKHRGHDLAFDRDLGVYVVVDVPGVWFLDGSYFRIDSSGRWEVSVEMDGPWRIAAGSTVPVRLQQRRHPHGGPPGLQKKSVY
jgi:hypothetical protein